MSAFVKEGVKVVDDWLRKSQQSGVEVIAYNVKGTKHQNYSDFPVLSPELTQGLGVAGATGKMSALLRHFRPKSLNLWVFQIPGKQCRRPIDVELHFWKDIFQRCRRRTFQLGSATNWAVFFRAGDWGVHLR